MGRTNRLRDKCTPPKAVNETRLIQATNPTRKRATVAAFTSSSIPVRCTEVIPLTPTAVTDSSVKHKESTPVGQHIHTDAVQSVTEYDVNSSYPQTFTDMNRNSILETMNNKKDGDKNTNVNENSIVHRSPSERNLLKQLQTTLSPKLTSLSLNENKRVSRYGRHQKQKENINYVPVELTKFVTKSPAKVKSKKAPIMTDSEMRPESLINLTEMRNDIINEELEHGSPILEVEKSPLTNDEMLSALPVVKNEPCDLLDMDAINIIGMNVSFENINDENMFLEDPLHKIKIDNNQSSDVDSAKGSSIDFDVNYRVGQIYWGAQSRKTVHWPCIVRVDPITKQVFRKRSENILEIHVAFFSDRGRRGWIRENYMEPFNGLDNYCARVENLEFGKVVRAALKAALRQTWKQATQQAEECCSIEIGKRLEHFDMKVNLERMRSISNRVSKVSQLHRVKRERSSTPESPKYDAIPVPSGSKAKRIKLELQPITSGQPCIESENESDTPDNASHNVNSTNYDDMVCNLIISMARNFLLNDTIISDDTMLLLQKYARKIILLKNQRPDQKHNRTKFLRELCQIRKLSKMMDEFQAENSKDSTKSAAVQIKKEKLSLEEEFIIELDPKSIMKGVPKGFVCYICERPQNVVKCAKCQRHMHLVCITTNPMEQVNLQTLVDNKRFSCNECTDGNEVQKIQKCFICNDETEESKNDPKYRCTGSMCSRQYHDTCLKLFPQFTTIDSNTIICPYHVCHTCVALEPNGTASTAKTTLLRCTKCPSSYHPDMCCIPAGSELLTTQQLVCPRHSLDQITLNLNWCFICSKGGYLMCCEACPNAVHGKCLPFKVPEGKYFCEACECGRFPLYNEIVIAKLGSFRWWPGLILPPSKIPESLLQQRPSASSICVKFFQSRSVAWLNRRRMYLYQDTDSENLGAKKSGILDKQYRIAMDEASKIFKISQAITSIQKAQFPHKYIIPPSNYQKIKTNRYVDPLKQSQTNEDSSCDCRPDDEDPCGPNSSCINRTTMIECISKTCPAKERCSNQRFAKRLYPKLEVRYFAEKGYGVVANEAITSGQFIIEYVGEVINMTEFQRRVRAIQERRKKNYYFLTVEHDMTIDAGAKGNISRFINHSCGPNCETQKWTIGNTLVVGLFAIKDIQPGEELTFNYNLESLGNNKRACLCGAAKCSGFIGEKYRPSKVAPNDGDPNDFVKGAAKPKNTMKGKKRSKNHP